MITDLNSRRSYIQGKEIEYLFDHLAKEVLVSFCTSSFTFLFFSPVVRMKLILPWYLAMVALGILRLTLLVFYKKFSNSGSRKIILARIYTLLILIVGTNWSFMLIMIKPPAPTDYILAIHYFVFGQNVIALYQFFLYPRASMFFSLPSLMVFTRELLISSTPISIALGVGNFLFFGFIAIFTKQTKSYTEEKMELRAEIEEKQEIAEKANRAKSRFLAAASHDIRQPLQSISLFTSVLEKRRLGGENDDIVNDIRSSVSVLEDYLSTLLDISKIDSGELVLSEKYFNINRLIRDICDEFTLIAGEKGISLTVECINEEIYADPIQLSRILRNLISNAIRYTPNGFVKVICGRRQESINIKIIDSGIGISKENHSLIFEEYTQIANKPRSYEKGVGLGLSIVKRLVQLMAVNLELISELEKGSCFILTIPIKSTRSNTHVTPESEVVYMQGSLNDLNLSVFLIDDDPAIRKATLIVLRSWGCIALAFNTYEDLKKSLINSNLHKPDIVIADYQIDGSHTGIDAVHLIESTYNEPVQSIIISGDTESSYLKELAKTNMVLYKPIKPAQLRACLNKTARKLTTKAELQFDTTFNS